MMMKAVFEKGFQVITSRHKMFNNAILIPKLKAGFIIQKFEVSDVFGSMVHLAYFVNPARRKMMSYRAGEIFHDDEIQKWTTPKAP